MKFWYPLSTSGVVLGTLFFAASLTPTLLPRTFLTQGIVSGVSFAAGYGAGLLGRWLWSYFELPTPRNVAARLIKHGVAVICAAAVLIALWRAVHWQNSIRTLMGLEPVASAHPLEVGLIALMTFAVLKALSLLFKQTFHIVSVKSRRFVSRRVSNVVGIAVAVTLFWSIISGLFFRAALHLADSSFQQHDALIEPETQRPMAPLRTGSSASLLEWEKLGRAGREYVSSGPTKEQLQAFSGKDPTDPIRVYVGRRSADTLEERARLALEELKRVGGFDRSMLVVVTPTGTGWVDPAAMDSIEYLYNGDVASVALQYSYLSSWLSLLVEPDYGADAARALFSQIYGYWTKLPRDHRPKLYLHGLSLGAMNSALSAELFEVLGDPPEGAFWSGPPYTSRLWRSITANRNPGSPAWLPRFRDGSFVRFLNQGGRSTGSYARWGPMRVVYLQYASDPVTFFDYRYFYREPAWMARPRGPDVSPDLRWYPVVTVLQLALDMTMATTAPIGHGHVYAPEHYVDGWIELTDPDGWTPEEVARLKRHLARR